MDTGACKTRRPKKKSNSCTTCFFCFVGTQIPTKESWCHWEGSWLRLETRCTASFKARIWLDVGAIGSNGWRAKNVEQKLTERWRAICTFLRACKLALKYVRLGIREGGKGSSIWSMAWEEKRYELIANFVSCVSGSRCVVKHKTSRA